MIVGLGVDLLENKRVEQELTRGDWRHGDGIFTREEMTRCNAGKNPALRYAACFAAKEATLKALRVEISDLGMFHEVEISLGITGAHAVVLHDRLQSVSEALGVRHIRVSTAAAAKQTGAMVILES